MSINKMKIAPHLFIGLGGCGSQIVNEIARKLKRKKEEYERYRNLVHFFAFDTDMGELKLSDSVDHWVPISRFDKREYVEHAFGLRGAPEDELFTSWWPEYYMPRATSGAGAGQIRIESRLSVYRTLKAMPQYLTAFTNCIRRAYDVSERWRDTHKQPMIHVYASLAGGTGSGSFLTVAYLARALVQRHENPIVVGTLVLPAVFAGLGLPSQQIDKIMANGYAALMELEHLQSATDQPEGRIRFQFDPNAKAPTLVTHGPFNQIYLVDDVGQSSAVLSDPRQVYPNIADAAYTQIFTDIIERDRSTADNDEREIAVSDEQHYTKRYGSFGLSTLVLPDEDILEYAARRYAAEAIERAFALTEEAEAGGREKPRTVTPEQRAQQFVRELDSHARLPGEMGTFYKSVFEWVDGGGSAGTGAAAELQRKLDGQLPRLNEPMAALPRISEDWLLEFEDDPDSVRVQLARRLEAFEAAIGKAKETAILNAQALAEELSGESFDHSLGKLVDGVDALRVRLLLIRLEEAIRQRQTAADQALREAEAKLEGWRGRYQKLAQTLEATAPKTFTEKFTGNDYLEEVPTFVQWFKGSVHEPMQTLLVKDAELELYDAFIEGLKRRRETLATLFAQLGGIRDELLGRCAELLRHGVGREQGGETNEHILDIEVYQDHLHAKHQRVWNVLYRRLVSIDMFKPEEIARSIAAAQREARGNRHVRESVIDALVDLGYRIFRPLIIGEHDPKSIDEMGLQLLDGLKEEARISWAWNRLRTLYDTIEDVPPAQWTEAMEDVTDDRIDEYVGEKLAFAARKCAPFWQLTESATKIQPKKYINIFSGYLDDDWLRRMVSGIGDFYVSEGNILKTSDPKRIVFYWNEMGVPIYRVTSIDEYGRRYEFVKMDELRRGPIYKADNLKYRSTVPARQAEMAACEGRQCPDIPLHTERGWEGAPDPGEGLFPITMAAVQAGRAKAAWLEARATRRAGEADAAAAAARRDIRAFALCRALGIIDKGEDGYAWTLAEIDRPKDRVLGKFLDEARKGFDAAREPVRAFALKRMEAQIEEIVSNRDRQAVETRLQAQVAALEVALLKAGPREAKIIEEETAVLADEIAALLEEM